MTLLRALSAPKIHRESGGLTSFSIPLNHSQLRYFAIAQIKEDETGAHHYVELGDQVFGKYDGLVAFEVALDARSMRFKLNFDVSVLGREFTIESADAMDVESAEWARSFAAEIAAR